MPADLPLTVEPYRDRKRLAWLLSLAVPLTIAAGPVLWLWHPVTAMLWLPVAFSYAIAPLLDWALGTDASNPPESAVPALDADPYYRRITLALVPLLWGAFIFAAWFSQHADLTLAGQLGLVIATGGVGGFCINLGHEAGHKRTPLERAMAKLILAPTGYGHFTDRAQPRPPPRRGHAGGPGLVAHGRIDLALRVARDAGRRAPRVGAGT
jgi:alkane 1-monooxygenase